MADNKIKITEEHSGQRLDRWLKKIAPTLPYGQAQKLIRTGQIRIDGKRAKSDSTLIYGQEVRFPPSLADSGEIVHTRRKSLSQHDKDFINSLVVHENDNIIALNKPHGLATQGGSKTHYHIDGLLDGLKDFKNDMTPKLLHRIDKDTSGLLLCGKTNDYSRFIAKCFKEKMIDKTYIALCSPAPEKSEGRIRAKLLKSKTGKHEQERMVVDEEYGQHAVTDYIVLESIGKDAALVCFKPLTGRTHQLRVHAQLIGSPIVGDPKYTLQTSHLSYDEAEDMQSRVDSIFDLCAHDGLHLHALAAEIPAHAHIKPLTLIAPLSKEIASSLKNLNISMPSYQNIQDFTKI